MAQSSGRGSRFGAAAAVCQQSRRNRLQGKFHISRQGRDPWEPPFVAGSTIALQVDSSFGDAGSGNPYLLSIIIPAAKITSAPAVISGPDLVRVSGQFNVYSDGVNAPVQITLVSTDSAAW